MIEDKTKEELEKEIRGKFNKRFIKITGVIENVREIFLVDNYTQREFDNSYIAEKIKINKDTAAKKLNVPNSSIKMHFREYWGDISIRFYIEREETNKELEKRIQTSLRLRWSTLSKQQEKIKRRELDKKRLEENRKKRIKENAMKSIKELEELDLNIYEVFQEINKKRNEKYIK